MAKRCLIVTYYFPPLGGGGVQRMAKLSKYLARAGWQVTVITADETNNHLEKDTSLLAEIAEDVNILYLPTRLPASRVMPSKRLISGERQVSYFKRWLSAFFYVPDIRKGWIKPAGQAVLQELERNVYDCVLVSVPPFSLAILAKQLQDQLSVPVILDMRDPWTINPYKIHPTIFHRLFDKKLERDIISNLQYGISITESLLSYYRETVPHFKPENWLCIPNGYDEEDFSHLTVQVDTRNGNTFDIGFLGTFYSHINLPHDLFAGMALLNSSRKSGTKHVHFHHIGKANIDLKKLARKFGVEKQVVLHGYLPHLEALARLSEMDAFCIIADTRNPKSRYTGGSKFYEYLRLRKPILALLPRGSDAAETIINTDAGVVVESSEHDKIARTLKSWMENPPAFSFKGIEQFSRENQARTFIRFFEDIARAEKKG